MKSGSAQQRRLYTRHVARQCSQRQRAYSLLEVLIAVFVTALGFLGVAALQAQSLLSGQEGMLRIQASAIADELAARIRSNREAVASETMNTFLLRYVGAPLQCSGTDSGKSCRAYAASAGSGDSAAACSSAEISAFDLREACLDAQSRLPDGEIRTLLHEQRLSLGVAWSAAAASRGMQEGANADSQCRLLGFSADRSCVVLELIP